MMPYWYTMKQRASEAGPAVFTIGHSNHPLEKFLELLKAHEIAVLVDVRSIPSSRYTPHFNRAELEKALSAAGVRYVYAGGELGGMPNEEEFYDRLGHVDYAKMAQSDRFRSGIARLKASARTGRTALMCSEEDPRNCHRHLLLSRVLAGEEVRVMHIRGDGALEADEDLRREAGQCRRQLSLFPDEEDEWKSTRSVLPERAPGNSSKR